MEEGTRKLEKEDVCVGIAGIVWGRLISSSSSILRGIEICEAGDFFGFLSIIRGKRVLLFRCSEHQGSRLGINVSCRGPWQVSRKSGNV